MKKQRIALVAIAAAMFAASAPSWAFQSVGISTVTAGMHTNGSKVARFTLSIRDTSNPFGTSRSSITWSGVDPLSTGWKIADQLVVMNSTVTDVGGGIQIYTDNTAADATPKFVDPTPAISSNTDSAAAGLLEGLSGTTSKVLPMAWSIKGSTKVVEGGTSATGIGATDPNTGATTGSNNKYQWLFVTDKYNTLGIDFDGNGVIDPNTGDAAPFVNGAPFIVMRNSVGVHNTQDPNDFGGGVGQGKDAYVYFQANFATAAAQQNYQTTTLRFEAFLQ